MKAKITRNDSFAVLVKYALDKGPGAKGNKYPEMVGGNMSGRNVEVLLAEFGVVRSLRPKVKRPAWHCSLSLPHGERLESSLWGQISNEFMEIMGLDTNNFPYFAPRHNDTDYDHIHIVASRIGLDGKLWHGQFDVIHALEATQALEKRYGLKLTPGFDSLKESKSARKRPSWRELKMKKRTGDELARERLQRVIDEILGNSSSMTVDQFEQELEARGASAIPNLASTGRMNGYAFFDHVEKINFKGSSLGKDYSWAGLQKRGLCLSKEAAPQLKP